jgi:mRNA-degrading endonuclease toxin of MazEF toxin-antitoxin module
VWWTDLDKPRPCVVVSSDDVLGAGVWQTHVVPVTSNLDRAGLAGNVLLDSSVTGLPKDSVAVPLGLELVERSWLAERAGRLPRSLAAAIDDGIRAVLDLQSHAYGP